MNNEIIFIQTPQNHHRSWRQQLHHHQNAQSRWHCSKPHQKNLRSRTFFISPFADLKEKMIDLDKLKEIIKIWAYKYETNNNNSITKGVVRVYLFGSQLKETANKNSDIDIALEFPELDSLSTQEKDRYWLEDLTEDDELK
jgi:predicted nucleotidyltransferase